MKTKQRFAKDYVTERSPDGVNGPSRAKTVAEWTKPETAILHGGGRFTEQQAHDYYGWACRQVGLVPEPKSWQGLQVDEAEYEEFLTWKDKQSGKTNDSGLADDKCPPRKVEPDRPVINSRIYDKNAPKQAMNLSVNSDLAARVKGLGINLSEAVETVFAGLVAAAEREKWLAENAAAIEAYNLRVSKGSILSDFERPF